MIAAFFDTSVIIRAADTGGGDTEQRDLARSLLLNRAVTVSTQVLAEVYSGLCRGLGYAPDCAVEWVRTLRNETVTVLNAEDVVMALETARRFGISHWDSLIIQAAQRSGLDLVYTQDLEHGRTYGPVRICNPFIEDFLA